jgi:hypothetical protein
MRGTYEETSNTKPQPSEQKLTGEYQKVKPAPTPSGSRVFASSPTKMLNQNWDEQETQPRSIEFNILRPSRPLSDQSRPKDTIVALQDFDGVSVKKMTAKSSSSVGPINITSITPYLVCRQK